MIGTESGSSNPNNPVLSSNINFLVPLRKVIVIHQTTGIIRERSNNIHEQVLEIPL